MCTENATPGGLRAGPSITLRTTGVTAPHGATLIRFGSAHPHDIIKAALGTADLYDDVLSALTLPAQAVLVMSCFAITGGWTVQALAEPTGYTSYRHAPAASLLELGYELWPTDVTDSAGNL